MLGYLFSYFNGVAGDEEFFTDKKMAVKEAKEYGFTDEFLRYVAKAAPMHDLGKIAVSDVILNKPGKFTPEEFEEMKESGYNEEYWVSDVWSMGGFRFITRDREAGNEIERFETLEEANQAVANYEATDKADETYTEDFYEIYDSQLEKVVE